VYRDFVALSERDGAPGRLGGKLRRELGAVFATLKAPGRDLDDLPALTADLTPRRAAIGDLLAQGARSRDPKTSRFSSGLLAHETALWTFTRLPGVPATNYPEVRIMPRSPARAVLGGGILIGSSA